jgi:hypothetical protein
MKILPHKILRVYFLLLLYLIIINYGGVELALEPPTCKAAGVEITCLTSFNFIS